MPKQRLSLSVIEAEDKAATGGLTATGKMPWYSFSLPARECQVGGRLRQIDGSVCRKCYAMKGNYVWPGVLKAQYRRLEALTADPTGWADGMVRSLKRLARRFYPSPSDPWPAFRWMDAGDLQGAWHLDAIARVAWGTLRVRLGDDSRKAIRHWLPTREYSIIEDWMAKAGKLPPNLNIRLSAHMVDGPLPRTLAARYGLTVSGVTADPKASPYDTNEVSPCPAYTQGGECQDCRACWDKKVPAVVYPLH